MSRTVRYELVELTPEQVQAKLAEIGHPLSERDFELAWVAASILIGSRAGDRRAVGPSVRVLGEMVTLPAADDEGGNPLLEGLEPTRWPYPEARGGTSAWSMGKNVADRLGLDGDDLDRLWKEAKLRGGARPKLTLGIVCAFVPPPMLAALAAVIRLGAAPARDLLERYLLHASLGVAKAGPRKGQPILEQSLEQYETAFRAIALVLHKQMYPTFRFPEEDRNAPPQSALAGWHVMPPPLQHKVFKAPTARTDRTAPEHHALRQALASTSARVGERLTSRTGLLAVTEELALKFFTELGGRRRAVAGITKDDLIAYHPPFDGPAVRLWTLKGKATPEPRLKPISRELYARSQQYLDWSGLAELPARTIWISGWDGKVGRPLPPSSPDGTYQRLQRAVKRALDEKPPHTVRHAIFQYAATGTRTYIEENEASDHRLGRISETVGATALLDHSFAQADVLGYGDLEADREKFSLIAWRGIRHALYSEAGARHAPDWHRIEKARANLDAARRGHDGAARRLRDFEQQRHELELRNDDQDDDTDEEIVLPQSEGEALVVALLDEIRNLRRENREERRRRRALTVVTRERDDAQAALAVAEKAVAAAQAELRLATETWVPVSDLLSDDEYDELCRRAPGHQPVEEVEEPDAPQLRRAWVTPKELARASGRSEATVRNYLAGRTRCPWWDRDDLPRIVHGRGRVRAAAIFEIDEKRVSPIMWERLLEMCKQPPPRWYESFELSEASPALTKLAERLAPAAPAVDAHTRSLAA